MLITFRSDIAGDVLMMAEQARTVLQAAGREYDTVPEMGVFTVAQLEEAIRQLEQAINADPGSAPDHQFDDKDREDEDDEIAVHPISENVSLRRRASPLLDMMRQAKAAGKEVVWEKGSAW